MSVPAAAVPALHPVRPPGWMDSLRIVGGAMVLAVALRIFAYEPFSIPTESMLPNLQVGDYLFVAKWRYGFSRHAIPGSPDLFDGRLLPVTPERGDIAVFKTPRDNRTDYIKRVIGLSGDRIELREGRLLINDQPVQIGPADDLILPDGRRFPRTRETLPNGRSYLVLDTLRSSRGDNRGVFIVPAGHLFMMGDNRDDSADSRFPLSEGGLGFVPVDNLVGRASISFFSTDGGAKLIDPRSWWTAMRGDRIGLVL